MNTRMTSSSLVKSSKAEALVELAHVPQEVQAELALHLRGLDLQGPRQMGAQGAAATHCAVPKTRFAQVPHVDVVFQ